MSNPPDSPFPSTSIGRVQGSSMLRAVASHETLSAHPLLSPTNSSSPIPSTTNLTPTSVPKYVPYTPRQRPTPTSATTTSISASQQIHGDATSTATSKLQLMNLKAAAQGMGLDTGTVGWAILERLVMCDSEVGGEWGEVWASVTSGKTTLLLPLEPPSHEAITADFVKDHLVLSDGLSRDDAPIITLSGLRGILSNQTLTIRSSIHPSSPKFPSLLDHSTRPSALQSLPPLPSTSLSPVQYPTYTLPTHSHSLPLPPRPSKPPLPPRPNVRPGGSTSASRLGNPFASLFGKNPSSNASSSSLPPGASTPPPPPPLDIPDHVVEISAFAVDRKLVRKDISKQVNNALKAEVSHVLSHLPTWIVERVLEFTTDLFPFVKARKNLKPPLDTASGPKSSYYVNSGLQTPVEISENIQDFYAGLDVDLRKESESGEEKGTEEVSVSGLEVRDILESVEKCICELFYDRLFLLPTSDDLSHDEALSSRIAALNMLDLGLQHLDVNIGNAAERELDAVVKACGEKLGQLDVGSWSPAGKAAILVAAHRVVVDGLSRLPPIRLKSDVSGHEAPETVDPVHNEHAEVPPIKHADLPDSHTTTTLLSSPISIPTLIIESDPDNETPLPLQAELSRSPSPPLTLSPPHTAATPISSDILLPILIFSVVKSNPPHFISHLLYTQRFRNQSLGGEGGYCLINLMAVAEFLENVDLAALGLGEGRVMSTADLTPIPINRSPLESPSMPTDSLRGRVEQRVDIIAGSANKVLLGVVDTSFGVLRSLLPLQGTTGPNSSAGDIHTEAAPWNRPGFGLLRRENGFSIASIAASLPGRERLGGGAKSVHSVDEESGQQLVVVSSRPASVKSGMAQKGDEDDGSSGSEEEEGEEQNEGEDDGGGVEVGHDARSIRSFESMMKGEKRSRGGRRSLSDRLAHMSGLSKLGQGSQDGQKMSSLRPPSPVNNRFDTPISSRDQSPVSLRLAPPIQRFLECSEDDIRVSEVGELLREYRRLVEGVRAIGGFDD